MSNPRIAVCLPNLGGAGAEGVMLRLAVLFARRGCRVDLVVCDASGELAEQPLESVRLIDLGQPRVSRAVSAFRQYFVAERPSAILSTLARLNVAVLMACRGIRNAPRVVIREANTTGVDLLAGFSLRRLTLRMLAKRMYPRADAMVALSQDGQSSLARFLRIDAAPIRVIKNPLNWSAWRQTAGGGPVHAWLEPPARGIHLVGMGRLERQKGFDVLVKALRLLPDESVRLVILGQGPERARLEALCTGLCLADRVSLPGFVRNPLYYLERCDAFIMPSRYEGCPNALLQAVATGIPCVATDCPGGSRELVAYSPVGELVPTDDPGRMAAAIVAVLASGRERPYVTNSRLLAEHDEDRICDQYLATLLPLPSPRIS